jgi:hypothetical protein
MKQNNNGDNLMKRMKRCLLLPVALVVFLLLGLPMSASAAWVAPGPEQMYTNSLPLNAWTTNFYGGWTPYGQPWDGMTNFCDLRPEYNPGDGLAIRVDCWVNWNFQLRNSKCVYIFSVEVYTQAQWVAQANPQDKAFWSHVTNPGDPAWKMKTLVVNIPNADMHSRTWCVYYTCEVIDLNQVGNPPYFDIAFQNYWVLI